MNVGIDSQLQQNYNNISTFKNGVKDIIHNKPLPKFQPSARKGLILPDGLEIDYSEVDLNDKPSLTFTLNIISYEL